MKFHLLLTSALYVFSLTAIGQTSQELAPQLEAAGIGAAMAYQAALARADVAVAKSMLNENFLKGDVGEQVRDLIVDRYHHHSGRWINISPRLGPQGLDGVSVQLDSNGRVRKLMVDEAKFGSSKLSRTKSGDIQMGDKWCSDRLRGLANRYDRIRSQAQSDLRSAKPPPGLSSKRQIPVPVSASESVVFWRPVSAPNSWCYYGSIESLPKAIDQLKEMSKISRACADGKIEFPKRIFHVNFVGDTLKVNILDAKRVDAVDGSLRKLPLIAELELPLNRTIWASDAVQGNLASELLRKVPHLDPGEARHLAQGIQSTALNAEETLSPRSFGRFASSQSAKSATLGVGVAIPLDIAVQLLSGGTMDWSHVAGIGLLAGGSSAVGDFIGNAATYGLIRYEFGYAASTAAAEIVGMRSASKLASCAGGSIGSGAAVVLFAYGGYFLGYYDIQTANRSAFAGGVGLGAGYLASWATLELISVFATAGTGTAIATLGGASATSASLAWLGGGSLATGGLGVAGGTVLVSTGVGIVVVGVTGSVYYGFQLYDQHQDTIRLGLMLNHLKDQSTFPR